MARAVSGWSGLFLVGVICESPALAQTVPLDSTTAQTLLDEATVALREAAPSWSDANLLSRLARLREAWGLDGQVVRDLLIEQPRPRTELERFVAEGAWDDAIALVRRSDPMDFPPDGFDDLLRGLIAAGFDERAVQTAAHLNRAATATYWILNAEGIPPEVRIARVQEMLSRAVLPKESELDAKRQILWLISESDANRGWAVTDTISDLDGRIALRISLASRAYWHGDPQADRRLRAAHADILGLEDEVAREAYLNDIRTICEGFDSTVCRDFALPPHAVENVGSRLENGARNAIAAGQLDTAERMLDSLAAYLAPSEIALLVVETLTHTPLTEPALERLASRWTAEAEALAATAEPAVADSLLAFTAPLTAPRNSAKAFELAERIREANLRNRAFAAMAYSLVGVDVMGAWHAARRATNEFQAQDVAARLYPIFRSLGDTVAAAEALRMMIPQRAPDAQLEWAGRLGQSGQWSAARAFALDALERWSALEVPGQLPSHFDVLVQLGMYDELVARARALQQPGSRAQALTAIIEAAPLPYETSSPKPIDLIDTSCLMLPGCDIIGKTCSCSVRIKGVPGAGG